MLDHLVREDDVEGRVVKRQLVDAPGLVSQISQAARRRIATRSFEGLAREIDAHDFAGREALGKSAGDAAGTAADVQETQAR